jgi:AcrR family transcriptional regulator
MAENKEQARRAYHHGRLRDALLEAALNLVSERGPFGFTLAEAAKRVGVTAAAPYRHFTDRAALMSELARRGFEIFAEKLERAWDGGRPDPAAALTRIGRAYLDFARSEPGLYSAMFANVETLSRADSAAAADRALETIRRAAAALLQTYGANDLGARELSLQLWAHAHGVAMLAASGHLSNARGADPYETFATGARNLVEMAVRRSLK